MSDAARQLDAFTTPGTLLKSARTARGMSAREAADRLHLMPDYVAIIERDEYDALRSPAFARGYLKAYCRLLDMDDAEVLALFDDMLGEGARQQRRIVTRPLQLQRTGLGVVIGLGVLFVLVVALWWSQAGSQELRPEQVQKLNSTSGSAQPLGLKPPGELK